MQILCPILSTVYYSVSDQKVYAAFGGTRTLADQWSTRPPTATDGHLGHLPVASHLPPAYRYEYRVLEALGQSTVVSTGSQAFVYLKIGAPALSVSLGYPPSSVLSVCIHTD